MTNHEKKLRMLSAELKACNFDEEDVWARIVEYCADYIAELEQTLKDREDSHGN